MIKCSLLSSFMPGLQSDTQAIERVPQAALRRLTGGAGHLGDFVESQIRLGSKEEYLALSEWERVDCAHDCRADRFRLRAGLRPGLYRRRQRVELVDIALPIEPHPMATPAVCAPPSCNGEQVRHEAGACHVSLPASNDCQPYLLYQLLEVSGIR